MPFNLYVFTINCVLFVSFDALITLDLRKMYIKMNGPSLLLVLCLRVVMSGTAVYIFLLFKLWIFHFYWTKWWNTKPKINLPIETNGRRLFFVLQIILINEMKFSYVFCRKFSWFFFSTNKFGVKVVKINAYLNQLKFRIKRKLNSISNLKFIGIDSC